jgi:hypothetical protein
MNLKEEQLSALFDLIESEKEYSKILGENERYELFNGLMQIIEPEWEKITSKIILNRKNEIMKKINKLQEE